MHALLLLEIEISLSLACSNHCSHAQKPNNALAGSLLKLRARGAPMEELGELCLRETLIEREVRCPLFLFDVRYYRLLQLIRAVLTCASAGGRAGPSATISHSGVAQGGRLFPAAMVRRPLHAPAADPACTRAERFFAPSEVLRLARCAFVVLALITLPFWSYIKIH
jgi:hypothetical protein